MYRYSFIIITNGKRDARLLDSIHAIRSQCDNEVIVVGFTDNKEVLNSVRYINESEAAFNGYITKLKNIGCSAAYGSILIVMHDDVVITDDFVEQLQLEDWSNANVLGCKYIQGGQRVYDWAHYGPDGHFGLCYDDVTDHAYIDGSIIIIPKSVWAAVKWDENKRINEMEDVDFSHRLHAAGYILKANPGLRVITTNQGPSNIRTHIPGCNCEN